MFLSTVIIEIATSSRAKDLGVKLKMYERMGVQEYLIAVTSQKQFLWKKLTGNGYQPLEPATDGIFRSHCFPGLWLDADALWNRDVPQLFRILQQGLATPEHTALWLAWRGRDSRQRRGPLLTRRSAHRGSDPLNRNYHDVIVLAPGLGWPDLASQVSTQTSARYE